MVPSGGFRSPRWDFHYVATVRFETQPFTCAVERPIKGELVIPRLLETGHERLVPSDKVPQLFLNSLQPG